MTSTNLTLAVSLLALSFPAFSQQGNIRSITRYRIAGGKTDDFRAAVKEYEELLKKGGSERYDSMWQSLTGAVEFHRVQYYRSFAELDRGPDPKMEKSAATLVRIADRILQCVESSDRVIEEILPNQSLPFTGAPQKMVAVIRNVVKPDKVNEYMALIDSDLLPAAKKAGTKLFIRSHTRFGGQTTEYRTAIGLDSWSSYDGKSPITQAMGEGAYNRFLEKIRPLLLEAEWNVYRFVPEMSHLAPAQ